MGRGLGKKWVDAHGTAIVSPFMLWVDVAIAFKQARFLGKQVHGPADGHNGTHDGDLCVKGKDACDREASNKRFSAASITDQTKGRTRRCMGSRWLAPGEAMFTWAPVMSQIPRIAFPPRPMTMQIRAAGSSKRV